MEGDRRGGGDDLMADVNAHVHDLAQRLGFLTRDEEPWSFLCECGSPDCHERVALPLRAYEALRRRGDPVLAPGHAVTS